MSAILSRPQCVEIEVPGASNKNMTESIHKYIVQAQQMLLKITMTAMTTYFSGAGLHKLSCVSNTL